MPSEDNKLLKYNSGEKSLKVPFIIYADLERFLQKINTCQILKNLTQKRKLSINPQAIHWLNTVHLITQVVIIEKKTV